VTRKHPVEWAARIGRLNAAINAEVDDLMDSLERGPDDWAARGLAELGRHLAETAADTIDLAESAAPAENGARRGTDRWPA
jgi:hypothetical protein